MLVFFCESACFAMNILYRHVHTVFEAFLVIFMIGGYLLP